MDTVVMKNIFPLRYEIHYWPLESGYYFPQRENEMVRNVHDWHRLNLSNLEAGGVVKMYLPNVDRLLEYSDQKDSW